MDKTGKNKTNWTFIAIALLLLFIIFFVIVGNYYQKIQLSLPVYFFLLVICGLAATALLMGALKSSGEYSGNLMKGKLRISGAVVVFAVILVIGYRFRPVERDVPFDLTVILRDNVNRADRELNGTVQVELDNHLRKEKVDADGKAVFLNVNAAYAGKEVPVSANIEGFRISEAKDTFVMIPEGPLPVIRLLLYEVADSSLFTGYLMKSDQGRSSVPVPSVKLVFNEFDKTVNADSIGQFRLYLSAKPGDVTSVTAVKHGRIIFSGRVTLSRTMQIFTNE